MAAQQMDEFEPFSEDDGTTEVINISGGTVRFEIDGSKHVLRPGERRRFATGYCAARRFTDKHGTQRGDLVPSVIEMLTGSPTAKVVPVTDPRARGIVSAQAQAVAK